MSIAKTERLQELRKRLSSLTEEQKQQLLSRGLIATIEGRILSPHNTIMVYFQSNGTMPTVVGGYRQWLKAKRQVKKGEHGSVIWFPVGSKDKDGDIIEADTFYTAVVFDISQTEEKAS